uniref:Cytochrome b5 n=1 Tax=Fopius arisanus TaxID=64838 RepID=A0A0C9Q8R9_9HYME
MVTLYSADEVARHNNENDIWLIMNGGVYDVTKFLKEHPGGEEVLLTLAGQDGTTCFDDIGHTTEAIQLRETLKIGEVGGDGVTSTENPGPNTSRNDNTHNTQWMIEPEKQKPSPLLPISVGIFAVFYILFFYYWS